LLLVVAGVVDLLTELERVLLLVLSITRPVLESITLPELSIILVLDVEEALLFVTALLVLLVEVLSEIALRVVAVLPDNALREADAVDDLPESIAADEVLLAELVLYEPELLPDLLCVKLL
jgi:hypothetical protein